MKHLVLAILIIVQTTAASAGVGKNCVRFFADGYNSRGKTVVFEKKSDVDPKTLPGRGFVTAVGKENGGGLFKKTVLFYPRLLSYEVPALFKTDYYEGPAYDLTPLKGIKLNLVDPSVKYVTGKLWKDSYGQFSKPMRFLAMFLLISQVWNVGMDQMHKVHQAAEARHHRMEMDLRADYLKSDFRYSEIRAMKGISEDEKAQRAKHASQAVVEFFNYYKDHFVSDHKINAFEADRAAIFNVDFGQLVYNDALEYVSGRIVLNSPGVKYEQDFTTEISAETLDELVSLETIRFFKLEFVHLIVNNPAELAPYMRFPQYAEVIGDIQRDPYTRELFSMKEKGQITADELVYRLGEDVNHQYIAERNKLFKVTPMLMGPDGNWTNTPMTIEIQRQIAKFQIQHRIPHP